MSRTGNGGRERAYRALVESEELHRATLGSISDAVFLTDDDGVFTFICPNVDVIFGYVPDEVQAMTRITSLLGEDLVERAQLDAEGEIRNVEREVTSKTGEKRHVLVHIKRVSIGGSTRLYSCRDITDRRRAEEEVRAARLHLAHVSRLALVGQLVASIAHEIDQPLTSIETNASAGLYGLQQRRMAESAELRDILNDIRDQSRRAADVIQRVRALAGRRPLQRQAMDVNELATDIIRMMESEASRRGVSFRTQLGPSVPAIAADRVSLQQVLLNLLFNAMDAMDQSGADERHVVVRTGVRDADVEIAVSDNGHGIPSDLRGKVFDAFFTTKKDGLGLGLAIARSIVEAHDGRLWAEEHTGRGATFCLTLPVSASPRVATA
jgi:PAS domain S-box-containing protein